MLGLAVAAAVIGSSPPVSNCELDLFAMRLGGTPRPEGNLLVHVLPASDDPLALINIMSPQARMMDLSDGDYRRVLNLSPDAAIMRHWGVPIDGSARKLKTSLVATPGRCHWELIGYSSTAMQANRSRIGKDEFEIAIVLREFASDGSLTKEINKGGYGAVDTAKKVGRDAALMSLHKASVAMIENFGERSAKQRAGGNEVKQ